MRVLKGKLFLGDYSMKIVLACFEKFIEMSGGIERVCCNMANAMAARGHEVSIVYCYGRSGRPFYALDSAVKTYNLMAEHPDKWKNPSLGQCVSGFNKVVREGLRIFSKSQAREWNESCKGRMIQQEIKNRIDTIQPDIIVSFRYETSNYLLHFAHVKVPVITMFHMSPDFILPGAPKGEIRAIAESSRAQVLLKRDIPVVERFCPGAHVVWIPNAVPQYEEHADPGAEKKTYTIINAARLNKPQKRQHLLVEAFAGLAKDYPDWRVELWGGGNDSGASYAKELREQIRKYYLENQVFLKGESTHIINQYKKSDIFCFPSAYEGFPLAMTEAMSSGLPVVGFKSCTAVVDLIDDGRTGVLVDDGAESFAKGMKILMDSREKREKMGAQAREAMKGYAPEAIWNMWEKLLNEVVSGE